MNTKKTRLHHSLTLLLIGAALSSLVGCSRAHLEVASPESEGLDGKDIKELRAAIQQYDEIISMDGQDAAAYNNRGWAYSSLGQQQRAVADYSQALQLAPNLAIAYYNRGLAYDALTQVERAGLDFQRACDLGYKKACKQVEEREK